MKPLVTVIIPTYNWSTVLPYSLGSVLGQTLQQFEVLVVGDGCTDDSRQVVEAIADPRVRWIDIARTGHQSGPNNEGLRQARGSVIAYLGHDDLWLPHHLASTVAALEAKGDLACSLVLSVNEDGRAPTVHVPVWPSGYMPPSSVVHYRRVTDTIGGWRDYRELRGVPEHDLWRRALSAGLSFTLVPRLSVVKFPASRRGGVYRARPCHEQSAWLQRIQTEPDFEATELAKAFSSAGEAASRGMVQRVFRSVFVPRYWKHWSNRVRALRKGALIPAMQRFKGVDPGR